jgi:hypothetical protein
MLGRVDPSFEVSGKSPDNDSENPSPREPIVHLLVLTFFFHSHRRPVSLYFDFNFSR